MTDADKLAQVIREELVGTVGTCVCDEAFTSRNLRDPHCAWHNTDGDNLPAELAAVVLAHLTAEGWAQGREEWGYGATGGYDGTYVRPTSNEAEARDRAQINDCGVFRRRVTDWEPVEGNQP